MFNYLCNVYTQLNNISIQCWSCYEDNLNQITMFVVKIRLDLMLLFINESAIW